MFGEIALIFDCNRTADVISKNFSTCSSIDYTDFWEILAHYPNVEK